MSGNRYSALNRRPGAATSSLFESYPGNAASRPSSSISHTRPGGVGGPGSYGANSSSSPRPASPYGAASTGGNNTNPYSYSNGGGGSSSPYQSSSATTLGAGFGANANNTDNYSTKDKPPPKHFTASVLDALESQNDSTQTSLLSSKVAQLKSLTIAIGDEIRDSSSLAGQINEQFEGAGQRLKGTMTRMMRMADSTGIGWRVWLLFFVVVWMLFVYVWLF